MYFIVSLEDRLFLYILLGIKEYFFTIFRNKLETFCLCIFIFSVILQLNLAFY